MLAAGDSLLGVIALEGLVVTSLLDLRAMLDRKVSAGPLYLPRRRRFSSVASATGPSIDARYLRKFKGAQNFARPVQSRPYA